MRSDADVALSRVLSALLPFACDRTQRPQIMRFNEEIIFQGFVLLFSCYSAPLSTSLAVILLLADW